MPALIQPVCVPGTGCGFTASRPPRCTDKLGLSLQGPISITRWGQQLTVATTLQVPLEEASYLLDAFVPQSSTLASLPRTCFGWIHYPLPLHLVLLCPQVPLDCSDPEICPLRQPCAGLSPRSPKQPIHREQNPGEAEARGPGHWRGLRQGPRGCPLPCLPFLPTTSVSEPSWIHTRGEPGPGDTRPASAWLAKALGNRFHVKEGGV